MKKSKLIALLSTFSTKEIERFVDFVRSPYYNTNEQLVELCIRLSRLHPSFPEDQTSAEQVYRAAFPGEEYDKKKLGYMMSSLVKLGEQFLGARQLEKQEILFDTQVLKALMEKKQEKHYKQYQKKVKTNLESQPYIDSDFFFNDYLLAEMSQYIQEEGAANTLQAASDALDSYYFINKLKYSCELLNRQAILSGQFSIPFMDAVGEYLKGVQGLPPLINIYLEIYCSLSCPDENEHFQALLELIRENGPSIDISELKNIYLYAINICTRKIREGKEEFISIALNLYEEGIHSEALFDNGYLSYWAYNNIVKLALRLNRFKWIERFIHDYNGVLQEEFRESALHYNLAELYFQKKNYGEVLTHLNQVQAFDSRYHLVARILLIKTFYESDALDACMSALSAFTVYLSRNKEIAVPLKKSCQHFCALLHGVMAHTSQKKREKIGQQIRTRQPLAERAWLMEVFEEQGG
ncbi:MAG: hypothetical protein J5I94_30005 [Phaeodactylibacter sp.]|nr:hypothetical protein [Phaeodactylibacter sp.]